MGAGSTVSLFQPRTVEGSPAVKDDAGEGSVTDISRRGFHVQCHYVDSTKVAPLRPGQTLGFRFNLPTGAIAGTAAVEWTKLSPPENGLTFSSFDDPGSLDVLMQYLTSVFLGGE